MCNFQSNKIVKMGMYCGEREHAMLERLKICASVSLSHSQHLTLENEESKTLP